MYIRYYRSGIVGKDFQGL